MVLVPDAGSFINVFPFCLDLFLGFVFLTKYEGIFLIFHINISLGLLFFLMPVWVFQVYTAFGSVF